jgi:hypothetical protein
MNHSRFCELVVSLLAPASLPRAALLAAALGPAALGPAAKRSPDPGRDPDLTVANAL